MPNSHNTGALPVPPPFQRRVYMRLFRWTIRSRYIFQAIPKLLAVIFHWRHPGVVIVVFVGVALAMASLAQNPHAGWLVNLGFGLAYLFFLLASVWAIGAWVNSKFLQDKNPYTNIWDKLSVGAYQGWKWSVSSGIFLLFVFTMIVTVLFHVDK